MRRRVWLGCFLMTAVLMAAGCKTAQIHNVENAPIGSAYGDGLSMTQVEKAIVMAGSSLGWTMRPAAPGVIDAELALRDHVAKVAINYSQSAYSINYADSTNLKYCSKNNTIHSNYNGWIQNLNRAIGNALSVAD
ncbi:MAG: hypothetical protein EOL87_15740 [Spartobacteria bacterium]|nr:hypothetical protein [Spartobacteria bacterium]